MIVDLEKRDRNIRGRRTELKAILVGPDRRVLQQISIPDDGRPRGSGLGPPQRARLSARMDRPGVYGLNVTVSQDRYGDEIVWGFRTNCPRYLIETARGHRDARREEPIVLLHPSRPGNVCFRPAAGQFGIEISGLPKEVDQLSVFDAADRLVRRMQPTPDGRAAPLVPGRPRPHRHRVASASALSAGGRPD